MVIKEFTENEWDVLMYVASYISGYDDLPSKQKVLQAGLEQRVIDRLIAGGALQEVNGHLQPGLQRPAPPTLPVQ